MLLINTWSVASFSKGAVHLPEGLLAKPISSILRTRKHGQFKSSGSVISEIPSLKEQRGNDCWSPLGERLRSVVSENDVGN